MNYQNIFDSHAHYDDEQFAGDLKELLARFPESGVCGVVSCGVSPETCAFSVTLSEKYPFIYAAAGFHPLNLREAPEAVETTLAPFFEHPKTVAVGEIGLDYHYEKETRAQQLVLF